VPVDDANTETILLSRNVQFISFMCELSVGREAAFCSEYSVHSVVIPVRLYVRKY